jgi:hypothetical protein
MWGTAANDLDFAPGGYTLTYDFPSLPLRPGPYSWLASLFEDSDELDMWEAVPEMVVATESQQHPYDEWSGLLNVPSVFSARAEKVENG